MKVIIDVKDSKAAFVMELLSNLSFVKARPLSDEDIILVDEIKEAVEDLKLIRKGKLEASPARDLIDEL
ncbi:hypothetical protein M8998_11520 [Sphingobacterium sp. lm-10]|uniref:hypothetical protein n=1 Tax=Sphingobacterium sp. lm-10 TaxID=2944904 RepID=UPI002021F74E|nr:hypothetical protein [Sphingobacterium sp. lm-10]MCL7988566.1 hypothetical protein [Sphingobacterium sp. lm-10]